MRGDYTMDGNRLRFKFDRKWGRCRRAIAFYPLTSVTIAATAFFIIGLAI